MEYIQSNFNAHEREQAILAACESSALRSSTSSIISAKPIIQNLVEAKTYYTANPTVRSNLLLDSMAAVVFRPKSGGKSAFWWQQNTRISARRFRKNVEDIYEEKHVDRCSRLNPHRVLVEPWAENTRLIVDTSHKDAWVRVYVCFSLSCSFYYFLHFFQLPNLYIMQARHRIGVGVWIYEKRRFRITSMAILYTHFLKDTKLEKQNISDGTFFREFREKCWFVSKELPQQCLNEADEQFRTTLQSYLVLMLKVHRAYRRKQNLPGPVSYDTGTFICEECDKKHFLRNSEHDKEMDEEDSDIIAGMTRLPWVCVHVKCTFLLNITMLFCFHLFRRLILYIYVTRSTRTIL